MEKTHWKKLTNPDYLGSWDIPASGLLKIKILSVSQEMVADPTGNKSECVVAQIENQKPFIINHTNCKMISKIVGSPLVEDWAGKEITLVTKKVNSFGSIVDGLRVAPTPGINTIKELPELTPESDRWAGAVEAVKSGKCDISVVIKNFKISQENLELLKGLNVK
jgi:hypothetical protein